MEPITSSLEVEEPVVPLISPAAIDAVAMALRAATAWVVPSDVAGFERAPDAILTKMCNAVLKLLVSVLANLPEPGDVIAALTPGVVLAIGAVKGHEISSPDSFVVWPTHGAVRDGLLRSFLTLFGSSPFDEPDVSAALLVFVDVVIQLFGGFATKEPVPKDILLVMNAQSARVLAEVHRRGIVCGPVGDFCTAPRVHAMGRGLLRRLEALRRDAALEDVDDVLATCAQGLCAVSCGALQPQDALPLVETLSKIVRVFVEDKCDEAEAASSVCANFGSVVEAVTPLLQSHLSAALESDYVCMDLDGMLRVLRKVTSVLESKFSGAVCLPEGMARNVHAMVLAAMRKSVEPDVSDSGSVTKDQATFSTALLWLKVCPPAQVTWMLVEALQLLAPVGGNGGGACCVDHLVDTRDALWVVSDVCVIMSRIAVLVPSADLSAHDTAAVDMLVALVMICLRRVFDDKVQLPTLFPSVKDYLSTGFRTMQWVTPDSDMRVCSPLSLLLKTRLQADMEAFASRLHDIAPTFPLKISHLGDALCCLFYP
jgi:hypothetical protein